MKKNNKFIILFILLIGIAFAYVSTNLSIIGNGSFGKSTWNIYFDNIRNVSGSEFVITEPTTNGTNTTSITYNTHLPNPGDNYSFYVDVVNDGSTDAMINIINTSNIDSTYAYLNISYYDGVEVNSNDLLEKESRDTLFVEVGYKEDIDLDILAMEKDNLSVTIGIEYKTANKSAKKRSTNYRSFNDDSWDTINSYAMNGVYPYEVGDTKCVALNGYSSLLDNGCPNGEFKVRVANTSTPEECNDENFSESACGMVIEFDEKVTLHNINSATSSYNYGHNIGGWPVSSMREFVNNDIYNSLPNDLKNNIIYTKTVSGYGNDSNDNNTTRLDGNWIAYDKLYLLSYSEMYVNDNNNGYFHKDTSNDNSRQLDIYKQMGITTSNYSDLIKYDENGYRIWWWLRSSDNDNNSNWTSIKQDGSPCESHASDDAYVIPAFRLGPKKMNDMSWDEISDCAKSNTCNLKVGDSKCVHLDGVTTTNNNGCDNGDFSVRLSNISTPSVCEGNNFSQSACGYVFEFNDIVAFYNMNETDTAIGGWNASDMRSYLNGDGYNLLPPDLKRNIINTYNISGYAKNDNNGDGPDGNWTSIDKLYILAPGEIWEQVELEDISQMIYFDSAITYTRQLDYYKEHNISTANYVNPIKKYNRTDAAWWLRSAHDRNTNYFTHFHIDGYVRANSATRHIGIVPVFRLGNE